MHPIIAVRRYLTRFLKWPAGILPVFVFASTGFCFQEPVFADSWKYEKWVAEPFTGALGGGPDTGPVEGSGSQVDSMCSDDHGNLYLANGQYIDIVTPDGIRRHLAGNGVLGYRDGPAPGARFRMGYRSHYSAYNISCSREGIIYVADSGNKRIRRVFSKSEEWLVTTWAGGGRTRLEKDQSAPPLEVRLKGTISVAVNSNGVVFIATDRGAYRVSQDGSEITYLGGWPESTARIPEKAPKLHVYMGDQDSAGNVYFVSRTPDVVLKIDDSGRIQHMAGLVVWKKKPEDIGDGPPLEAYFNTPSSLVADPDGKAVYVCGGDEYDIRRVPTDGTTHTATLMQNGRWYNASVHPNRSRGAAVVRPDTRGKLKPDGALTDLMVAPLTGGDNNGNLYGKLVPWRGMTQYIDGRGLLPTRVFRLRPSRAGKQQ